MVEVKIHFLSHLLLQNGTGLVLIGKIVELRFHSITASSDVFRYNAVIIELKAAARRTFNKYSEVRFYLLAL